MNRFFLSFFLIPLLKNIIFVDLMVPAAKKAHAPKYKLFGGTCYITLKATAYSNPFYLFFLFFR